MGRLDGKVAMVTGGAMGLGEATCLMFAKEGAKVVITTGKSVEAGQKVVEQIRKDGGDAAFVQLDVRKEEQWQNAMEKVIQTYGKINILVNNAGIVIAKNIEEATLDSWNLEMDVLATGVFLGIKYAIKYMKDNGENCSIVNISSIEGKVAESVWFSYCAAKGAVRTMTKASALHCGEKRYKIRVNSVNPGYIHTPMNEQGAKDQGISLEEYYGDALTRHPIGHIGKPSDIAYANLYLASDESLFVSGSDLFVDGGYTAQ
ncbi:MAG: SDR family oxidoreductase [Eubacteriales bacterium]